MIELIKKYRPYNKQEEVDKKRIIDFIEKNDDCLSRRNDNGHLTVSVWVVNPKHTHTLMIYHKIYDSWSWIGGHCDGNENFHEVALKELYEETGVHGTLLSQDILSLEVLTVDGHIKKGKYVSSHLHYNLTFLVEVNPDEMLVLNKEETNGVAWFSNEDALKVSTEKWYVDHIYTKLMNKVRIHRIQIMETIFDSLLKGDYNEKHYNQLEDYYHSSLWLEDYKADENGLLPSYLKRGILSEDALYNYFSENKKGVK